MAENTTISWTDKTWSPWYGCTQVSMGEHGACVGCYARHLSETRMKRVVFGGPGRGEGTRDARADAAWKDPLRWDREAAAYKRAWEAGPEGGMGRGAGAWPYSPFVFPSMCDPFDNHPDLADLRRRFFDLIRATPHLTWLLLTKRPGNIVKLFGETNEGRSHDERLITDNWPRNAAIGCTVVTQEEADRDIPKLLAAKRALKPTFAFVSMEPLLGPVDLRHITLRRDGQPTSELSRVMGDYILPLSGAFTDSPRLDWVITGGETDQGQHKARPSNPDWFRSLRDQCAAAGVAYQHKQNGEFCEFGERGMMADGNLNFLGRPDDARTGNRAVFGDVIMQRIGKKRAGRYLDGVTHDARPEVR
jgi:protein gp37